MDIRNFYEIRAAEDSRTISGCAIKFDTKSVVLGNVYETISRSAVDQDLIDRSDILFTYNHDRSKVLARSRRGEGSLHTELRDDGLYFSFEAPNTQLGNDTLEEIRRGDLVNCSFAFRTKRDKEHYVMTRTADGSSLRTILKIDSLHDLSCVYEPAYEKTYLEARSAEAAEDEELLRSAEEEEQKSDDEEEVKAPEAEEQKPDESEEEQKSEDETSEDEEERSDEDDEAEKPEDEKPAEDEEQKSDEDEDTEEEVSDSDEKEEKDDAEERSNVKNNTSLRNMENFSLIQTVNDIIACRGLNEAARQINEFGVRSMKEAGYSDVGQFVLPYVDTRSAVTVAAEGEDVVPTQIMDVLGPLRAKNVLVQSGAKFMSGLSGDIQIPSYSASNCAWKGETTAAEDGAGLFGHKTFSPKKLTTYVQVSKQFLIQATPDAEEILRNDLIDSINDKLEETLLGNAAGTTTKPAGIFYNASLNDCSTYAGIAQLEADVENKGIFEGKYILSPGAKASLRTTQKGSGTGFVWENNAIDGVDALSTAHVKTIDTSNGTADQLVYGDWKNFAVCSWGPGLSLTVDPYTGAKNDVVNIIVTGYFDGGVLRDDAFGFGKIEKA